MRWIVATIIALLSSAVCFAGAGTIYVDDDAPRGGDGSSWSSAYDDLRLAMEMAPDGSEVRVAGGTYKPDVPASEGGGDRLKSFVLKPSLSLLGGYAGLALPESPDVRDIELYETVLSGDLNGDDGPGFVNYDDNSVHVLTAQSFEETARIDGVTVRGGNAVEFKGAFDRGGGCMVNNASVEVSNSIFEDNFADFGGGGISATDSSLSVTFCAFRRNDATNGGGVFNGIGKTIVENSTFIENGGEGGAVRSFDGQSVLIDCLFERNVAGTNDPGGAIELYQDTCDIQRCQFIGNTTQSSGGAVALTDSSLTVEDTMFLGNIAENPDGAGGGISCSCSELKLIRCIFLDNQSFIGGGVYLTDSSEDFPRTIVNCVFAGNHAPLAAGGLAVTGSGDTFVTNSTFYANTSSAGGGLAGGGANTFVRNCIFRANFASTGDSQIDGFPDVAYCVVEGGYSGEGVIDADPLFVDPAGRDGIVGTLDDDLRLSMISPAIDAGDNEAIASDITIDLDGLPRFVDEPCIDDTGLGRAPIVDLGAYEYQAPFIDCNRNALSDVCDLIDGTAADCNGNIVPDSCDIASETSTDLNRDAIPDECQDCDDDGLPDLIGEFPDDSTDCNGNGEPDNCDIALGTSEDCNDNGMPDECETMQTVEVASGPHSPFGFPDTQMLVFHDVPLALEDVVITIEAQSDLDTATEFIIVQIEGESPVILYQEDGSDCQSPSDTAQVVIPQTSFNELMSLRGTLTVTVIPSSSVLARLECRDEDDSFLSMSASYLGFGPNDLDGDGVPNDCECTADLSSDGAVGFGDLLILLDAWGVCRERCAQDLNDDSTVGFSDLLILLDEWGPC